MYFLCGKSDSPLRAWQFDVANSQARASCPLLFVHVHHHFGTITEPEKLCEVEVLFLVLAFFFNFVFSFFLPSSFPPYRSFSIPSFLHFVMHLVTKLGPDLK